MTKTNPQTTDPDLLSVAEAALALAVSRTTVYRIDRENGPFRIVKQGRRVFVDRCTFNQHLAARSVGTAGPVVQEPHATETPEPLGPPERSGSGQRELVRPGRWPTVVVFVY